MGLYLQGAANRDYIDYFYTGSVSGSGTFDVDLSVGQYEVRHFQDVNYNSLVVSSIFSVSDASVTPGPTSLTTSAQTYLPGESINVTWTGGSANYQAWVGLYRQGASNTDYLAWFYTERTNGNGTFDTNLSIGSYEVRLFYDNGYTDLVSITFEVATSLPNSATSAYMLKSARSGKCADLDGTKRNNGDGLMQSGCANVAQHQWSLEEQSNGYYLISNELSGKCIDISGTKRNDGDKLIQWSCVPSATQQQWSLEKQSNGYYLIRNRSSNKCVDISGTKTNNGDALMQWTCVPSVAQHQWQLIPQ